MTGVAGSGKSSLINEAFLSQHPDAIVIDQAAVGVSTRSLELSFREFKGVTPSVYLRQIRLQAAHSELIDPASTLSIADLCVKWGFFHFGRFSELYRKAYGVSPSEARRQSARPGSP